MTRSGINDGDPDDFSGSCLRKHKKDRVLRRGPGVAELEKILREQDTDCTVPLPPPSSPIPPPPPVTAIHNTPASYSDVFPGNPTISRRNHGVVGCGTPPIFPFSSLFSNGSFPNDMFQRKQHHSLHQFQTMNLPNPPGFHSHQFIELPSNQRSYLDSASQFLEEEKIVGSKRQRLFLTGTCPSTETNTKCTYIPSDAKQSRTSSRDLSSFIPLAFQNEQQEGIEEYMRRRASGKPLHSFLPSDEQSNGDKERTFGYEATADHGIDLSLRL